MRLAEVDHHTRAPTLAAPAEPPKREDKTAMAEKLGVETIDFSDWPDTVVVTVAGERAFQFVLSIFRKKGVIHRTVQDASLVMVIRALGGVILYMSQIVLARWMGKADYGIYSFVWAWVWLAAVLAGSGLPSAAYRFIPQ